MNCGPPQNRLWWLSGSPQRISIRAGQCRMSAMHWEARRRQFVLAHRLCTHTKKTKENQNPEQKTAKESRPEQPVVPDQSNPLAMPGDEETSHRITDFSENNSTTTNAKRKGYSAKIENRYTSIQYAQQW
ncbi:hypothetical protein AALO_G00276610 [Alosa alosa]|uniref:Uncharacterized protein n=1 Tax=Alosa alosa TaxID=278164 RepID=A0AAV6FID5_9TELE|nr:hypothetical protein AALO_G00276610 [Alosa alosa]